MKADNMNKEREKIDSLMVETVTLQVETGNKDISKALDILIETFNMQYHLIKTIEELRSNLLTAANIMKCQYQDMGILNNRIERIERNEKIHH